MTEIISAADVDRAVAVLRLGGLVAFPTETVYGLGGDASNPEAVARIFEAKGRPAGHPLIVHVADAGQLDRWAVDIDNRARRLADAFWPGPLTLILRRSDRATTEVVGGRETVGIRVPDHPAALQLLRAFDGGLAGPSANRFGHVSPTTAQHVVDDLDGRIDLVLDGDASSVGVESTIVEVLDGPVTLLRPGGVSVEQIEEVLGESVVDGRSGESRAAGMLASHYAPRAPVMVITAAMLASGAFTDGRVVKGAVVVSAVALDYPEVIQLSPDADAFARGLYAALRQADQDGATQIVIVPPVRGALLPAVLDRLMKAAAPRV